MHIFKLTALGALGALGVLRGLELVLVAGVLNSAVFPLVLGILCAVLFLREWKKPKSKVEP